MELRSELNVTAPSSGRFGTTISSLADLNGDGLRDVAVGAPLEDDDRGAVYVYLGDGRRGIRSHFSQVRQSVQTFPRRSGSVIHIIRVRHMSIDQAVGHRRGGGNWA